MTDPLLRTVEIEPEPSAERAVIWLHGLGADGNDFPPIVPELGLDPALRIRWVFPHAPAIPVTVNMGMVMPAWYDIVALDWDQRREDGEGVLKSDAAVRRLLERERERGVPPERIVLAGFSQGGAVAAHLALRYADRLAGLVALSTYAVRDAELEAERTEANSGLPVFQGHGLVDPMVPCAKGEALRDRLQGLGHEVEWHAYPMQHQVCLEEIQALGAWFARVFA